MHTTDSKKQLGRSRLFKDCIMKRKNKKSSYIKIPVHDIVRVMTLPQPIAAQTLGVSISTLKRRFYELQFGRWPNIELDAQSVPTQKPKKGLNALLNEHQDEEANIDNITMKVLHC